MPSAAGTSGARRSARSPGAGADGSAAHVGLDPQSSVVETSVANAQPPLASVIVPARNPGPYLDRLLAALERQTVPVDRFEVILADDGSTDGVTDAAAASRDWVRVTSDRPQSSYAARNRATRLARAPVLAFCDADCVPEPDWLENGLRSLGEDGVVAGLIRFELPARTTIWTLIDMDTFLDQERAVRGGHAVTANLFVPRRLFESVGRFDESIPEYGDYDLVARCVAAGARLRFERGVVVRHPTRDDRHAFLRKLWVMNWWYGVHEGREGRRPFRLRLRALVPIVQPLRSRRYVGKSVRLDRRRLAEHGIRPRLVDDLRAVPLIYLVLPYFASVAQLGGWRVGRRSRKPGDRSSG